MRAAAQCSRRRDPCPRRRRVRGAHERGRRPTCSQRTCGCVGKTRVLTMGKCTESTLDPVTWPRRDGGTQGGPNILIGTKMGVDIKRQVRWQLRTAGHRAGGQRSLCAQVRAG
eukprot:scaffold256776_cov28-Tisochrysis_lutea.AAC.2